MYLSCVSPVIFEWKQSLYLWTQIWSFVDQNPKFRWVGCWSNDRKFHSRKTNLSLSVDTNLRENYCNIIAQFILKDYIWYDISSMVALLHGEIIVPTESFILRAVSNGNVQQQQSSDPKVIIPHRGTCKLEEICSACTMLEGIRVHT